MFSHGWRFPRFRRPLIPPRAETRIFLWVMLERVVHEYAVHRLRTCKTLSYAYACTCACTRGNTWHTRARIARTTAAERGQRVASPVNNAGRGNGAISTHLLLNVRFAVLPPRVPPRVPIKRLLPRSPLPTTSYSPRATHLYPALNLHPGYCHPDCSLLGGRRGAGVDRPCDPRHTSLFHGVSFVETVNDVPLGDYDVHQRILGLLR